MTTYRISPQELARRLQAQMAASGTEFAKCCNCGSTYPIGSPTDVEGELWTDRTVCSERCFDAYRAYLMDPDL